MATAEANPFLSEEVPDRVTTRAGIESPVTRSLGRDQSARDGWQKVIDHRLIEWGRDPALLEDESVDPPTRETIQRAVFLAEDCRDAGFPPPDSVVPDPNGGVVFESCVGNTRETFHVWDDGSIEYLRFEGTRLTERRRLR